MHSQDPTVTAEDLKAWEEEFGAVTDLTVPNEENMVNLFSDAFRETDRNSRAQLFVNLANMSLAMADSAMGSHISVATCLVLRSH